AMSVAGLLTGLVLAAASTAPTLSDLDLLRQAETAFRQGLELRDRPEQSRKLFRAAADHCAALQQRGVRNADLFRNLGNANLLAGDLPRAILAYRRGLVLAPNDTALRANLEHAREQVVLSPHTTLGRPPVDHWPPWLARPSPRFC